MPNDMRVFNASFKYDNLIIMTVSKFVVSAAIKRP